jgi:hypothetical protein
MNPHDTTPIVKFTPNQPVVLTVKYGSLKPCQNGRYLLSTKQGSAFFNAIDAERIHELGLHPGEKLECLYKRIGKEEAFAFSKIAEPQQPETMESRPAAAATSGTFQKNPSPSQAITPETLPTHEPVSQTVMSSRMAGAYIAAIDAIASAQQYAAKYNIVLKFSEESIQCSANSIFIQFHRELENHLKYGGSQWQRQ